MAKQTGILKIQGTIGGMTFYKTQDGHLVREKGGVSGDRIANDPAFVRTRENGEEFGAAGIAGKLMRDSLRSLMMNAADGRVTSRLTQLMSGILKMDTNSDRGKRTPALGLATPEGKAELEGFDFNVSAVIGSVLFKPYALNSVNGVINFSDLVPVNDIAFPGGATHMSLTGGFANIDFETGIADVKYSQAENLTIDANSVNVSLTPSATPAGTGIKVFLLKIEFFQEVNSNQYSLKNGAYNALAIIGVA
jgi:hypothetical protein